jgi:hypothetical protein
MCGRRTATLADSMRDSNVPNYMAMRNRFATANWPTGAAVIRLQIAGIDPYCDWDLRRFNLHTKCTMGRPTIPARDIQRERQ